MAKILIQGHIDETLYRALKEEEQRRKQANEKPNSFISVVSDAIAYWIQHQKGMTHE